MRHNNYQRSNPRVMTAEAIPEHRRPFPFSKPNTRTVVVVVQ